MNRLHHWQHSTFNADCITTYTLLIYWISFYYSTDGIVTFNESNSNVLSSQQRAVKDYKLKNMSLDLRLIMHDIFMAIRCSTHMVKNYTNCDLAEFLKRNLYVSATFGPQC